jgi:3-dehydroquinate dehydratase-2
MTLSLPLQNTLVLINGPSLNLLGERNPAVYGTTTLAELENELKEMACQHGFILQCVQSNTEGTIIDTLQSVRKTSQGILINPGAYAHTSVAIHDALLDYASPKIEVHLSNLYKRETFRHHSYISPAVNGVICGFGKMSYVLGLQALIELVKPHEG